MQNTATISGPSTLQNVGIVFSSILANLMDVADLFIVSVAIPYMMSSFGATLNNICWVATAYMLASMVTEPFVDWMTERFSRRTFFLVSIWAFIGSSAACGLAPGLLTLILFRIIQGGAGGIILPIAQVLVLESFPPKRMILGTAIFAGSLMIAPVLAPLLGGYLIDYFGWRMVFYINVPVGLICGYLAFLCIDVNGPPPNTSKTTQLTSSKNSIDYVGITTSVSFLVFLQLFLSQGPVFGWLSSPIEIAFLAISITSFVIFIFWELRFPYPVINLRRFRHYDVALLAILSVQVGFVFTAVIFIIPTFEQITLGLSGQAIGQLYLPSGIAIVVLGAIGIPFKNINPRFLIALGSISTLLATYYFSLFTGNTSAHSASMVLILVFAGFALSLSGASQLVTQQFSGDSLLELNSLFALMRTLGGTIGITILSSLLSTFQVKHVAALSNYISELSPVPFQAYIGLQELAQIAFPADIGIASPTQVSVSVLSLLVQREAFVLSFEKIMQLWVIVSLVCLVIPVLFFLKPSKAKREIPN